MFLSKEKVLFLGTKGLNFSFASLFPILFVYYFDIEKLGEVTQSVVIIIAVKSVMLFTSATLVQKIAVKRIDFRGFYINQFFKELAFRILVCLMLFVFDYYYLSAAAALTIFSCFRENVASSLGVNGKFFEYGILSNIPNAFVLIAIFLLAFLDFNANDAVLVAYVISDMFFFFLSWVYLFRIPNDDLEIESKVEASDFIAHYILCLPTAVQSTVIAYFANHVSLYHAGLFKIVLTIGSFGGIASLTIKEFMEPAFKRRLCSGVNFTKFVDGKWIYIAIFFGIVSIPVVIVYGKIVGVDLEVIILSAYGLCISSLLVALSSPHALYLYKENHEKFLILLRWLAVVGFVIGALLAVQSETYMSVAYMAFTMISTRIAQGYLIIRFANRELPI